MSEMIRIFEADIGGQNRGFAQDRSKTSTERSEQLEDVAFRNGRCQFLREGVNLGLYCDCGGVVGRGVGGVGGVVTTSER